ncbi:rhodanese-like domain-containing protein [Buchnera aphidicola str. APS (Acyrthosiphon pisum)]|uniref:Uncharacterized protein BU052 n=1 Tax=Buchnera aphidicola subsp. Acyrthosiphon pisum (strain APS) TaxID=107806 RepID=Y052_BUCAI|nr:rhodanese-like domain-containing protein [Buchnera aphidicola]P57160.1 RecName: Full=Uncharacterized protein BU052 [Buchnera aphidicola str. APS (Acyrthosiphon pisum)]pir/G84935/ hypothetical protein yibN [imported] - Buchnera sp. (strain APS) [Buchnera sp. (in: enterobacteria)]BAB12775.1 hypothetical protein [Buchnera aphidicola str. APS (Acyrthosiphon pisum)]
MQDVIFFLSKHILLISIWIFCFIAAVFFITRTLLSKSKMINNFQAIKLINQDKAIVVDTRSLESFKEGHILNSINVPLKNIFLGKIKEIEIYKMFPIILVLSDTYKVNACIKKFFEYGFNRVYILKNGLYYWKTDNLPLIVNDK